MSGKSANRESADALGLVPGVGRHPATLSKPASPLISQAKRVYRYLSAMLDRGGRQTECPLCGTKKERHAPSV